MHIKVTDKEKVFDVLLAPINQNYYLKSILFVLGTPNYLLIDKVLNDTVTALKLEKSETVELDFERMDQANKELLIENNREKAETNFEKLGLNIQNKTSLLVMEVTNSPFKNPEVDEVQFINNLKSRIKKYMDSYVSNKDFSVWYKNKFIIYTDLDNVKTQIKIAEKLEGLIKHYFSTLDFYISLSGEETTDLFYAYKEAVHALEEGKRNDAKITPFDQIGFTQVFTNTENDYYLKKFYTNTLSPILDLERERQKDLLVTLESFINNNLNYKDTADYLFVHPNTVRYRVQQIKKIFKDHDVFSNPEKRFNLQFALRLMNYYKK